MRWATRRHCHVDRVACAWLVVRFIDADASFVFVDDPDDVPACSFETFLRRYELDDPALAWIGRIVHECDLEDELFDAPEAAGLDAIVRGISLIADDDASLVATTPLFDGLYELGKRRGLVADQG